MRIRRARTVVLVVAGCTLALAACSATSGGVGTSSGASASATSTSTLRESGRTLTQTQLLAAGLQRSQWPKDVYALLDSRSTWRPSHPSTSPPPQGPAACGPLVDLMQGTSGASAAADVTYQWGAILGLVTLDSYPRARASTVFSSVRRAVAACPGLNIPGYLGTFYHKIVPLQAPRLGDESISFDMASTVNGVDALDRYDYVRIGAATVVIWQLGAGPTVPPEVSALLAPQVAKLRIAQS